MSFDSSLSGGDATDVEDLVELVDWSVTSLRRLKKNVHRQRRRHSLDARLEMLCDLPNEVILQLLKKCDPKSIENIGLTCQKSCHLVRRHRHLLPKFRVFLSVVFNGEKFEIRASLTIDGGITRKKNNGGSSDEDDSITFKKYQFCHNHLQDFFHNPDFEAFDVQSLLITARNGMQIDADNNFINWLWRFTVKHAHSLQYISMKNLNFAGCDRPEWSCFVGTLRMERLRKINELKRSRIYDLYHEEIVTTLRKFQEVYSTIDEDDVRADDEDVMATNYFMLSDFLNEECKLEYVDITSAVHWKPEDFTNFVTAWCRSPTPRTFKRWSVMKNGEFQPIVNALGQHPSLSRIDVPMIYGQTLVFKNSHIPAMQLHIYVERPLYLWITAVNIDA